MSYHRLGMSTGPMKQGYEEDEKGKFRKYCKKRWENQSSVTQRQVQHISHVSPIPSILARALVELSQKLLFGRLIRS